MTMIARLKWQEFWLTYQYLRAPCTFLERSQVFIHIHIVEEITLDDKMYNGDLISSLRVSEFDLCHQWMKSAIIWLTDRIAWLFALSKSRWQSRGLYRHETTYKRSKSRIAISSGNVNQTQRLLRGQFYLIPINIVRPIPFKSCWSTRQWIPRGEIYDCNQQGTVRESVNRRLWPVLSFRSLSLQRLPWC
jgi:hypothetical protein